MMQHYGQWRMKFIICLGSGNGTAFWTIGHNIQSNYLFFQYAIATNALSLPNFAHLLLLHTVVLLSLVSTVLQVLECHFLPGIRTFYRPVWHFPRSAIWYSIADIFLTTLSLILIQKNNVAFPLVQRRVGRNHPSLLSGGGSVFTQISQHMLLCSHSLAGKPQFPTLCTNSSYIIRLTVYNLN